MNATLRTWSCLCVAALLLWACGGGSNEQDAGTDLSTLPCGLDNPCPEGQACNNDQRCVEVAPLEITTESIPDGRVDFGYDVRLQAAGGLTPYRWSIEDLDAPLDWMSLSSAGRLTGTPHEVVIDGSLTVRVEDAATDGAAEAQGVFQLSIILCQDGDRELCYVPADGLCTQGERICADGVMGECSSKGIPSADALHCGSDCDPCDSSVADSCSAGLCTCGGDPVCSDGLRCCAGACTDTSLDMLNCGSCFLDCRQATAHVSEEAVISCNDGSCEFSGECTHGFLNCDGVLANGCELPVTLSNCGDCGIDCNDLVSHVSASQRRCLDAGQTEGFVCGYEGSCSREFADCDEDGSNGCEIYLNTPENCGACAVDCSQSGIGELCTSPDPQDLYFHECGCRFNTATGRAEGCEPGQICCSRECQDCARHCFDGASDAAHCGVCDALCAAGESCSAGGCTCAQAACPQISGATTCSGGQCVCAESGAGLAPCPVGYFCCNGEQGGSGGSAEGDPDIGCCRKRCGQNDWENFPCTL